MKNLMVNIILISSLPAVQIAGQGTWQQVANFPGYPSGGGPIFSIADKGYLGTSCHQQGFWEYDPLIDLWTQKADIPVLREAAASFVIENKGYCGTGILENNNNADDFWEYDPLMNVWTQKADFAGGKRNSSFSFSAGTKGYFGGGATNLGYEHDLWQYDPSADEWIQKADYPGGEVAGATGFEIDGLGFIGTGRSFTTGYENDFWKYDPLLDTWIQLGNFSGATRAGAVALSIDEVGYLGLGYSFDSINNYLHDFWKYLPSSDGWIQLSDFPGGAGIDAAAFSILGQAFIGSGGSPGSSGIDFWKFIPDTTTTVANYDPFLYDVQIIVNPNPVSTSSTITFSIGEDTEVAMDVFDISGRKVETLLRKKFPTGMHQVSFQKRALASGIYLLEVRTENQSSVIKFGIQ